MELRGVNKQLAGLKAAAKELGVLEEAETKAAKQVIEAARAVAPVRTGELRRSLDSDGGQMFSRAPYANPIHWGWYKRGIEPNMFLLNTARYLEPNWIRWFEEEIDSALKKAAD